MQLKGRLRNCKWACGRARCCSLEKLLCGARGTGCDHSTKSPSVVDLARTNLPRVFVADSRVMREAWGDFDRAALLASSSSPSKLLVCSSFSHLAFSTTSSTFSGTSSIPEPIRTRNTVFQSLRASGGVLEENVSKISCSARRIVRTPRGVSIVAAIELIRPSRQSFQTIFRFCRILWGSLYPHVVAALPSHVVKAWVFSLYLR
jgi:hypothetical protein